MKFIYGDENHYKNQIIKKFKSNPDYNIIELDNKTSAEETSERVSTISMFDQKNALLIRNSVGFKSKEAARQIIEALKTTDNEFLFVLDGEPSRKDNLLFTYLISNYEYKKYERPTASDIRKFIENTVESLGGKISDEAINKLISKVPEDLSIIENEINKLVSYENEVTVENVNRMVSDFNIDNYFDLANAIISGDTYEILKKYKNKIKFGADPVSIYVEISNLFAIALKIYILSYISGKSDSEIASILKIHPFRVKKTSELVRNTSISVVKENLRKLQKLDSDILEAKGSPGLLVEKFILDLIK